MTWTPNPGAKSGVRSNAARSAPHHGRGLEARAWPGTASARKTSTSTSRRTVEKPSAERRRRASARSVQLGLLVSKWPADRLAVRSRDPPRVGAEALGTKRPPVLPVGDGDVRAADVPGRDEEREADPRPRPRAAAASRAPPLGGGPRRRAASCSRRGRSSALCCSSATEARSSASSSGGMSISRADVPEAPSSAPRSSSTVANSAPCSRTPARFSSSTRVAR